MTYTILASSEDGGEEIFDVFSLDIVEDKIQDWIDAGDWPAEGAIVIVYWQVMEIDGKECEDEDYQEVTITVPPDHEKLIVEALGDDAKLIFDTCGANEYDHDWTSEGEGGCKENPGVWSGNGTTVHYSQHCTRCGLRQQFTDYGSQRNHGQVDKYEYSLADSTPA